MSNVDTQKESFSTVTQVVYKAVFEGTVAFREISEQKAEKRRAEEAAREEAARQAKLETDAALAKPSKDAPKDTPSVVLDIKSADISTSATTPSTSAPPAPANSVNLIA